MKKVVIIGIAVLGGALDGWSQGAVSLNNLLTPYGIAVNAAGDYYSGTFGLEVWELNGTAVPGQVNSATNVLAHNELGPDGFTLVGTWSGQTMTGGALDLGEFDMPSAAPGGVVVLALAAWVGAFPSWAAAFLGGSEGGVIAFTNSTAAYEARPPPIPPDLAAGWNGVGRDLVMTPLEPVPNTPPVFFPLAGQTNAANSLLSVVTRALDANPPVSFTLGLGAPAGASITPAGLFTWTPSPAQAPSTNLLTLIATDSATPPLSATNAFTVVVWPANATPMLGVIPTLTVNEPTVLTVTNTATDSNIYSVLTYALLDPLPGMNISANGIFTWTLLPAEIPSTNLVTTVVASSLAFDRVNPVLMATNTFTVRVREGNMAPVLPVIPTQTVNELTLLSVSATATVSSLQSVVSYALLNPAPGMSISPGGLVTWTPPQTSSPSTNLASVVATSSDALDPVNPVLIVTDSFTVIVREVNVAPALAVIKPQRVNELILLTVTNTATGSNIHSVLTYALLDPLPGMSISGNGIFTWSPQQNQGPGSSLVTTVVTSTDGFDLVRPSLSATNSFMVHVLPPRSVAGTVPSVALVAGHPLLEWGSVPGSTYQVQYTTDLASGAWLNLGAPITATGSTGQYEDFSLPQNQTRFYCVVPLP